ncbi:MAG TPA: glycosyltransferase family 4 protein [Planktothrix sp.]
MKVALITRDYHSRGGIERVSQFYARTLRSHGHEVHVWYGNGGPEAIDQGVYFHQIKTLANNGWLYALLFAFATMRQIKTEEYDATIVMGTSGICKGSVVVANSVHQEWFTSSLKVLPILSSKWLLKLFNPLHYVVMLIERLQYKAGYARSIIAVSEPIKRELNQTYGIPLGEIDLLPNGANLDSSTPDDEVRLQTRRDLAVKENEYLLCMLVNELERKGVRQTLAAMKKLASCPVKLLVVTRVDLRVPAKMVQEFELEERVILRPNTPDARPYLWASDLYVLPTQYEAWNLSIMEAHAAGLPIVTTALGQADQVVEPGVSGFLLKDPKNVDELVAAIERWLSVSDKNAMREAARKRIEPYSWDKVISRLESILVHRVTRTHSQRVQV